MIKFFSLNYLIILFVLFVSTRVSADYIEVSSPSITPGNPFIQHLQSSENPHLKLLSVEEQIVPPPHYHIIEINSVEAFRKALKKLQPNTAFLFADGNYRFNWTVVIDQANVMLLSQSAEPTRVVLRGPGMILSKQVKNLIDVHSSGFVLDGISLTQAPHHLIQIRAEQQANFPIIRNCILQDSYQQLIKVSYDKHRPTNFSQQGLIERCLFNYSQGIGPNFYIGGLDAHGVHLWVVRDNIFKDIASPAERIAEHAIHLWNNTSDNLIAGNIIIDSDRGIGFGMSTKQRHPNIIYSNFGGTIKNNVILHTDNGDPFADVGINVELSPYTQITGNSVLQEHGYSRAIEYRFKSTVGVHIENNRTNRAISSRDRATATLLNNKKLSRAEFMQALNDAQYSPAYPPHIQAAISYSTSLHGIKP